MVIFKVCNENMPTNKTIMNPFHTKRTKPSTTTFEEESQMRVNAPHIDRATLLSSRRPHKKKHTGTLLAETKSKQLYMRHPLLVCTFTYSGPTHVIMSGPPTKSGSISFRQKKVKGKDITHTCGPKKTHQDTVSPCPTAMTTVQDNKPDAT